MIEVIPFRWHHVDLLIAQGVQVQQMAEVSLVPGPYASLPRISGTALTALEDGRVLMCGGVVPRQPGHGELWALLSADCGKHFTFITRGVLRFIDTLTYRRLETTCQDGFEQGRRWLEILKFRHEGPCYGFGLNGETHQRYSRCRS